MLMMDPAKRLTGKQCLEHPYFDGLREEFAMAEAASTELTALAKAAKPGRSAAASGSSADSSAAAATGSSDHGSGATATHASSSAASRGDHRDPGRRLVVGCWLLAARVSVAASCHAHTLFVCAATQRWRHRRHRHFCGWSSLRQLLAQEWQQGWRRLELRLAPSQAQCALAPRPSQ